MKLRVDSHGSGTELVLLHGWGVNSGVWRSILPLLTSHYRVHCVDLPGHGDNRTVLMPDSLPAIAQAVLEVAPASACWLGWSLGGLVCQQLAVQAPARVQALILSNTTPRFVAAPDWPHAMPPSQLENFAAELADDFSDTVQRFLALQVLGEEHARATLRTLRDSVLIRGEPDLASLATGLDILRDNDMRQALKRIQVPTLILTGAYDRLTPPAAGRFMAEAITGAQLVSFPRTAHAPFVSHATEYVQALNDFIQPLTPPRILEHGD